ncbi:MAG: methanogenesis marker 16 metalloprotein [Methanobrevibacter sp.]|jgi:putative methanogenesis marker 16 metalloprotein|nr:methanogenesis marker 16 metalloprotein [Candidatus Methanoflexus mossambicus]
MSQRTVEEVNEKIRSGKANVFTITQLKDAIRNEEEISFDDVDVVTTGTCGIMSGTAAILHIPVTKPGEFKKAKSIFLNGVPAFPGPCPNEYLGSVDIIVYGTQHSLNNPDYGGGFLFKDFLSGEKIELDLESIDGERFKKTITIDEIGGGQLIGTRMAFKNYTAFINPKGDKVNSIFNSIPMEGKLKGLSFSGCGEYNPLQNDPKQNVINEGTKILLNGSKGIILGNGTRSSNDKPNLMLSADFLDMDDEYIGGFKTGAGPEVYDTIAIPIPVLNEEILENLLILDEDVKLPVADIHGRHLPITEITYGDVWKDSDNRPKFHPDKFDEFENETIKNNCPTLAINDNGTINFDSCFGCGLCATLSTTGAYTQKLNNVQLEINNEKKDVPIVCRQSDRQRALKIATKLKKLILDGKFEL